MSGVGQGAQVGLPVGAGVAAELCGSVELCEAVVLPAVALPPSAEVAGEAAWPPELCASAAALLAELDGAAEVVVQDELGLADAEDEDEDDAGVDDAGVEEPVEPDGSAELASLEDEPAGVGWGLLAAIRVGFFGGRAVSGGRTLVTSLITGEVRSAIAEAPLR